MLTRDHLRVSDVPKFLSKLRPEDAREVMSSSGRDPAYAIAEATAWSERTWVARDTADFPVLLFGVAELRRGIGTPWMLATTEIATHARQIARETRPLVEEMNRRFPLLYNRADLRNRVHIRWLRWAGCRFGKVVPAADGSPFIEFFRTPTHV